MAGDPGGRRIAREKANLISEARNVAHALSALVKRADMETALCAQLLEWLGREEAKYRQIGHGRIEPRRRFKRGSPQPMLQNRPSNQIFLDECGVSHSGPGKSGSGRNPSFFSLGAVAMDDESVDAYCQRSDKIKQKFFGGFPVTFHEPEMRNHQGRFHFDGDEKRQRAFDDEIDALLHDTRLKVFGVGIRKTAFAEVFSESGLDPYLPTNVYSVAILLLLERYLDFLNVLMPVPIGRVTFESIGPLEDAQHQLEFARLLIEGTQWVPARAFRNYLETGIRFSPKQGSSPLEIADMFARDLFEWVRSGCVDTPKRWNFFNTRIYWREDGMLGKFGVKVFPDADIRTIIEDHRRICIADSRQ